MKEKLSAHSGIIALILVIILAIVGCVFGFMRIFEERARNKELMAISESAAQEEPFEKGIVSEAGYESKYLNLRFTPPEGFVMCTDAEVSKTFPGMEDIAEMGTVSANGESIYFFAEDLPEENADVSVCVAYVKDKMLSRGLTFVQDSAPYMTLSRAYEVMEFTENGADITVKTQVMVRKQKAKMVYMILTDPEANRAVIDTALAGFDYY